MPHPQADFAPFRGVTQRVVQQIAQQHVKAVFIADDLQLSGNLLGELDPAAIDQRLHVPLQLSSQPGQIHRLPIHALTALEPGECQQLLDDTGHPIDPIDDRAGAALGTRLGGIRHQVLRVHLDRRQGRTQLVSGIGGEATLLFQRFGQATEQAIERIDHAADFIRRLAAVDGFQIARLASGDLATDTQQGRKATRDDEGDQERDQQDTDHRRHQVA